MNERDDRDAEFDEVFPADQQRNLVPRLWAPSELAPAEQPRWLARNRVPRKAVSLLVGPEALGKTQFWIWIAAAVTTGTARPEFGIPARDPEYVIIVATEDDWSTDLLPRLEVAGVDLAYVRLFAYEDDGSGTPTFPRDMPVIETAGIEPIGLIVVDAWLDTVQANLVVRDPQQARLALHPWRELVIRTSAAVLLLVHTNRMTSSNARDTYGVTSELRKKARLTLYCQEGDDCAMLVGPEKANSTGVVVASKFDIETVQHFDPTEEHDGQFPRLVYVGDSDKTSRQILAERMQETKDQQSSKLGETSVKIIAFVNAHHGVGLADVAEHLGQKDVQKIGSYMSRLVRDGWIKRVSRGLYVGVESGPFNTTDPSVLNVESVESVESGGAFNGFNSFSISTDTAAGVETRSRPICRICGEPLSETVLSEGRDTHPSCDPSDR